MEPPRDFKSLQEGVQKSLVSTVKTVNRLAAEDLSFQRTVNPDTSEQLDDKAARVLRLSTRLLSAAANACNVKAPKLEDAEDIDFRWPSVVDVVDSVLEKADMALDEFTGLIKQRETPGAESRQAPSSKKAKSTAKVIRHANVTKPQARFERKPDNFPTGPWKPYITAKPHATLPLDQSLVTFTDENGAPQYKHPYETEITDMRYPKQLFKIAEPIPPQPAESAPAIWVDTYQGVLDMLADLKKANEIAVDLEHHDFRTYTGIVCLMQISTREKDWIVDTLQPWRHKLEVLNQVFADPAIIKVFHGAYMDMVWLQRDLGLYVNGLFDTFFACDLLSYPGRSLAFLLSRFVSFDADKQYQLADWRIRPVPPEMMYYARSDTHYLLYIYDRLRNELISASDRTNPEKDYISRALQRSKELALSRHEHLDYNEETGQGPRGWYNFILKQAHLAFDGEQFAMFRALWKWRDATARKEDESPNFVLAQSSIISVARVNPPDVKALHSLLPLTAPLARARFNEIWDRVQEAKARGGPSVLHFFASMASDPALKPGSSYTLIDKSGLPDFEGEIVARNMSRSQLFGNMPISTRWEETQQASEGQADCIPFPWQRFVQTAMEAMNKNAKVETSKVDAEALQQAHDEEFTLKRGRKRKSAAVEEGGGGGNDDDEASDSATKAQRKKDRKLREQLKQVQGKRNDDRLKRKAKKQRKKDQKIKEKAQKSAETPFDYSNAASVMHAGRDSGLVVRGAKKAFDPYAKTGDDGLKGARRAPPVRGERSATFKK
ncbi:3'-5' exonuclease domain-containing protein [Hirsutella rhossiliensis]|uniref:3'-5' exonuclease domain-containing protein n=1 Tax=Hirsutella rhossiliensis TaxID=111463 RepID=A0A9P8SKN0_9HYPO|nr:3'-5' exonuclease domain-containing protein [Hirsutella rhossiliensis]KAH0965404.1 3'-5' exonuclease domain-containing protein [Hirsutella rhossiliensis]